MAKAYKLYVGIVTALALCKYSLAEWNATEDEHENKTVSLHRQGNSNNFTETQTQDEFDGLFTKCPKEYQHYCIHGSCRFLEEQDSPSCRCNKGYIGSRCEYFDLDWSIQDQRQIIVACVIAALVFMILLIIFICVCAHRHKLCRQKRRRKEETGNGTEKLNMNIMNRNGKHSSDSAETSDTNAV
ncbi:probetacellulin [Esox lucius]|uniref:Betacellulin, epidermal growth factor family member n=1 Tax=Esox lucius TaxID=8010 RepID=A0AAY5L742_ESOLU|nr:probetacellulin [Esox lucius]